MKLKYDDTAKCLNVTMNEHQHENVAGLINETVSC